VISLLHLPGEAPTTTEAPRAASARARLTDVPPPAPPTSEPG
jgi:hypothetical protein